ncbi:hypothetical protein NPIL_268771 [Nephila pilipes]|uniref:Uncharacterized protein n=1 Tax=Nephila pilipes TaxID=299642 RepID=A0A8X6NJF7_NEPPI|nr:hypothetical protein NPIL_268771 [Nephila pilipes]
MANEFWKFAFIAFNAREAAGQGIRLFARVPSLSLLSLPVRKEGVGHKVTKDTEHRSRTSGVDSVIHWCIVQHIGKEVWGETRSVRIVLKFLFNYKLSFDLCFYGAN